MQVILMAMIILPLQKLLTGLFPTVMILDGNQNSTFKEKNRKIFFRRFQVDLAGYCSTYFFHRSGFPD
jgi:hypothetical protein